MLCGRSEIRGITFAAGVAKLYAREKRNVNRILRYWETSMPFLEALKLAISDILSHELRSF